MLFPFARCASIRKQAKQTIESMSPCHGETQSEPNDLGDPNEIENTLAQEEMESSKKTMQNNNHYSKWFT